MKKYKQFVIGFLVGAILFSIAPVSAAIEEFICYKADYKVTINGSEFISEDLPILNYKGNTYAPFRPILEKAGLNVNWNAELGQAEVTSTTTNINLDEAANINTPTAIEFDPLTGLPIGAAYIENEKGVKKYKTIIYNDDIYIAAVDLKNLFGLDYKFVDGWGIRFYKDGQLIPVDANDKSNHFYANSRLYYKKALFQNYMGE
jgi:hypothetical protein